MSKRNDNPSDTEAGMTTAERRRYRRRGGALRVPSDDVPRSTTTSRPPSGGPKGSTRTAPYQTVAAEKSTTRDVHAIHAPDAAPTVIDPPGDGVDSNADFETKTHEMAAVDLEALGLSEAATTVPIERVSAPDGAAESPIAKRRAQTVALSDEDLEEVRGAHAPSPPSPPPAKPTTKPPPLTTAPQRPAASPRSGDEQSNAPIAANATPPASQRASEFVPESIADIDSSAEPTGEYEVEIEDSAPVESEIALPGNDAPRAPATPPTPPRPERKMAPSGAAPLHAQSTAPAPSDPAKSVAPVTKDDPGKPLPGKSPPQPPQPRKPNPPQAQPRLEGKPTAARVKPWYVDLFDEDYLRTLPFLTPQATQAEAEFVLESMNLSAGAQVLDVGCGYGRHAMELAARGLHVVGLDLSTPLLVRGGEEAQRRGLTINFVRGDMRELDFDSQFDAAYCLFSTFGYFEDETNKNTLTNIGRALRTKGRVLIEVLNRDYLIADLPARVWWEGDGCVVLEEVEFNYFSSRVLVNRSVVFDDGRQLEQEISVRAYCLHEIGKLMHAAGFRVLEVSGGYQMRGRFFGNQSRHIIVLAERKET